MRVCGEGGEGEEALTNREKGNESVMPASSNASSVRRRRKSCQPRVNPQRDALCSRIRTLGTSILETVCSAIREVEELECEEKTQQQRHCLERSSHPVPRSTLQFGQVGRGLTPARPSKSTSPIRPSKMTSPMRPSSGAQRLCASVPVKTPRTPLFLSRSITTAEKHQDVASPASQTPPAHSRPSFPTPKDHKRVKASSDGHRKRPKASPTPREGAQPTRNTRTALRTTPEMHSALPGSPTTSLMAEPSRGQPRYDENVAALCAAAEARFLRIFDKCHQDASPEVLPSVIVTEHIIDAARRGGNRLDHSVGEIAWECDRDAAEVPCNWQRGAPLYDLSNAAIALFPATSTVSKGEDNSLSMHDPSALLRSPVQASEESASCTEGGLGDVLLSPPETPSQALPVARTAPQQGSSPGTVLSSPDESRPHHAPLATPTKHTQGYFDVVYIRQSARLPTERGEGNGGSGHNAASSGGGEGRRPGRASPSRGGLRALTRAAGDATGKKADEEAEGAPLTVQAYVQPVFAVDENSRGGFDRAAAPLLEDARVGRTEGNAYDGCDVDVVRLDLCPPMPHRGSTGSPLLGRSSFSVASSGTSRNGQNVSLVHHAPLWGHSAKQAGRKPLAEGEEGYESTVGPSSYHLGGTHSSLEVDHHLSEDEESEVVAEAHDTAKAHIDSIEGWRKDRLAEVEDRIRRHRRPSFVSSSWEGEHYYYPASAAAAKETAADGAREVVSPESPGNIDVAGDSPDAARLLEAPTPSYPASVAAPEESFLSFPYPVKLHASTPTTTLPLPSSSSSPIRLDTSSPAFSMSSQRPHQGRPYSLPSQYCGPDGRRSRKANERCLTSLRAATIAAKTSMAPTAATRPHLTLEIFVTAGYPSREEAAPLTPRTAAAGSLAVAATEGAGSSCGSASPLHGSRPAPPFAMGGWRRRSSRSGQLCGLDIRSPIGIKLQ